MFSSVPFLNVWILDIVTNYYKSVGGENFIYNQKPNHNPFNNLVNKLIKKISAICE